MYEDRWRIRCGLATMELAGFEKRDVTGSKLFSQFCMHERLFDHRGGRGCGAVCAHPSD